MKALYLTPLIILAFLWQSVFQFPSDRHQRWLNHTLFEDFSPGYSEDSGLNLYVTKSGSIRMINMLDFNNDSYLDIFVPQDHNQVENEDLLIYWGSNQGPQSILPPLPKQQPLGRLLRGINSRKQLATRLPSDGGGPSLIVDLNNDGYKEIVFCNFIHNYTVYMNAIIYWGSIDGYNPAKTTKLPTLMAASLDAADFNQDGYLDLVFANNGTEGGDRHGYFRHLESYIYWNGPTGFSVERRSSIPTISAIDCKTADLNGDSYPDLIFLNNNSKERSVYLYWGGSEGFSKDRRKVWNWGESSGIELADLNQDSILDLVLIGKNQLAQIKLGTGTGFREESWRDLPVEGAASCTISDLNKDGFLDLVFPNRDDEFSFIYWGNKNGPSKENRIELPTLHATDATQRDFNNDGWIDVAFSNEHDEKSFDVNSYIYWNSPTGFHAAHRRELQGFGAVSLAADDLNRDGHQDLVLINQNSGKRSPLNSFIYWGNPHHHYSDSALSTFPKSMSAPAVADLNHDSWIDIAFPHGLIYWGNPNGYHLKQSQQLPVTKGMGAATADLNRDGYLDLVITAGFAHADDSQPTAFIVWGNGKGYDWNHKMQLKLNVIGPQSPTIADFNKDGFLDLIVSDVDSKQVDLFWGTSEGKFSKDHYTSLQIQQSSTIEVADLNDDKWLDLIVGGGWDTALFGRPTDHVSIVWGSSKGFQEDNILRLEGYDPLEHVVADLNKDGFLDIVMSNYHAYFTRSIPAFIYWGAADGIYSESRRSQVPAESSGALTVADFNQDSWLDIVVFNHLDNGDHSTGSNIFWGGPEGYSYSRRQWIQTFGPHFGARRDIGNIYDRKLQESFVSAPIFVPAKVRPSRLRWDATTPHGTGVKFQIRTAQSKKDLENNSWIGSNGINGFFENSGENIHSSDTYQWIQYRATLTTPNAGSTPILEAVYIDVGSAGVQ